jgi:NhaP-type Na+/H+ or K+/H+ antiporter
MSLDRLAERLLQPVNTSVISILGVFNILFGFWITLPFRSFDVDYDLLPELFLGPSTMFVGLIIVYASFKENMDILRIGTGAGFFEWVALMGVFIYMDWRSPWWIVALMIGSYCGFVYTNLKVNSNNLLNKTGTGTIK